MELSVIFTTLAVTFTDEGLRFIAAGLVMGLGALATPLGIGRLVASAMEALGRNPEALPAIQTNMILGVAFCEAIAIYSLIVAIMIGFVF
ncbi:MAG TPA: ATP synthase F0 subunit C [Dehalococcoidia bacterium]|nr:ATP synthase F0 subunit C [Dehalococcoidia bacterium]